MERKQLKGKRFGKLTAVEYIGYSQWRCVCDCGNEKVATTHALTTGVTAHCGCGRRYTKSGQKRTTAFQGCEEDCFNCKYDDCRRPDYMCHEHIHRKGPHVD